MNNKFFFVPKRPNHEDNTFLGKRVLVLGASFYCPIKECDYYKDCTGYDPKNDVCSNEWHTSNYDKCPQNVEGVYLHDSPSIEVDFEGARSYRTFASFMNEYCKNSKLSLNEEDLFYDFWDKVWFTNYIQHIIGGRTKTLMSDIEASDFDAFCSVLDYVKPDVVITWGAIIDKPIKYLGWNTGISDIKCNFQDNGDAEINDHFHWIYKGHRIEFISLYHPSSSHFHSNKDYAFKMLDKVFDR